MTTRRTWVQLLAKADPRDVLAFGGLGLIGIGLGDGRGLIAIGVGAFYMGVMHPLLVNLLRRQ